jgi:pimeloyl-ACP methyl ester carboxylesterase
MPKFDAAVGTISYIEAGSGRPLLLLHGAGNSVDMWREVIPLVTDDYRVIAADFPGHGDSGAPRRQLTIPEMTDAMAEMMTGIGIDEFAVAGTSLGGLVSLELGAHHANRITALVCNGAPAMHLESQRMGRLTFVAEMVGSGELPADIDGIAGVTAVGGPESDQAARRKADLIKCGRWFMPTMWAVAAYNPVDRLGRIRCPSLILMGYHDFHMATAYVLSDGIRNAKLCVLPDAGHLTPYDDPHGVARIVKGFLRENLASTP